MEENNPNVDKKTSSEDANNDVISQEETNDNLERRIELQEEKKQNRKIDISLFLSIVALITALLQLIVSSPFFTDYYYKASFEIIEESPSVRGKIFSTIYVIHNNSRNTANDIEVSIQMMSNDVIQSIPNRNIQFIMKENGPHLKDCSFLINKLVPNEIIAINIDSDLDSVIKYNTSFFKDAKIVENELDPERKPSHDLKPDHLFFPSISIAKFDKGFAEIHRQPFDTIFTRLLKLKKDTSSHTNINK